MKNKFIQELLVLISLAWPVIISQFSLTSIAVADTMMIGHFDPMDLSAVAVGMSIFMPTILFGTGMLMVLTPIIAQLNGSGNRHKIAHQTHQGLWLTIVMSLLLMLVLYHSDWIVNLREGIDPKLSQLTVSYLRVLMFGIPGYLLFQLYRNQCEGLSKTKPAMVISFIALICNLPINYILIYGKLGFPTLGGIGCAIACVASYWIMFLLMWHYIKHNSSQKDITQTCINYRPDFSTLLPLIKLGLPIAVALFFEVTLFACVSLLIAPLGINAVAGHNIVLNFSSLIFVVPLALSIACSIRVGHQLGEKSLDGAKLSSQVGLILALCLSLLIGLAIFSLRNYIPLLYTTEDEVLILAFQLLVFLAIYQSSDYLQVIASGVLRGYKDTKMIFWITLVSYWLVGLPSGYLLSLTDWIVPRLGPAGFWIGFIIGLSVSAIFMLSRIVWLQKQKPEWILNKINQSS